MSNMKTITIQITDEEFDVKLQNDSGEVKTLEEMTPNEKAIIFASANVLTKVTSMSAALSNNNPYVARILKVLSVMKTDDSMLL